MQLLWRCNRNLSALQQCKTSMLLFSIVHKIQKIFDWEKILESKKFFGYKLFLTWLPSTCPSNNNRAKKFDAVKSYCCNCLPSFRKNVYKNILGIKNGQKDYFAEIPRSYCIVKPTSLWLVKSQSPILFAWPGVLRFPDLKNSRVFILTTKPLWLAAHCRLDQQPKCYWKKAITDTRDRW